MSLIEQDLGAIDAVLAGAQAGGLAETISALRQRLPGLTVMRCDASDVLEDPYRCYPHFDLHLIDGASHCPRVTADPLHAGGVLLGVKAGAA